MHVRCLLPALLIVGCTTTPPEDSGFVSDLGLRTSDVLTRDTPGWTAPTKVVVVDLWPGRTADLQTAAGEVELVVVPDARTAAEEVADADAVMGALSPAILSNAPQLRFVQLTSAGVERYLAIPGLTESDLVISNAQRIFGPGGAEHVVTMMLMLGRRMPQALELQRNRQWDVVPLTGASPYSGPGSELMEFRGRTVLIAGLGGIGTEVARLTKGLGMRVVATRNSSRSGPDFVDYVGLSDELHELLADADVIVNALPLTSSTEHLFDANAFAAAKRGALFVNIGRGRTVDQDALIDALRSGQLGGAGLDVTDPEPLPADHVLWSLPNVIITPHIGGDSDAHMERMYRLFEENLRRFVRGDPLLSVVDIQRGY